MITEGKLTEMQDTPIDTLDIRHFLGEDGVQNTIKYSHLANYNDIFELLPTDRSYKIILVEQKKGDGHWTCIVRYGKTICTFDSYGCQIDTELKFVNRFMKRMLGQERHYLTDLLKNAPDDWTICYNAKKLQKLDNNIATCGKYCILFVTMVKDLLFTLEDFLKFFKDRRAETGLSNDELVSVWINNKKY